MDRIYDLIQETLAEVNAHWTSIGYSDEARKKSLEAFADSIKDVCGVMLAQLKEEQSTLEMEESRTMDQIRRLAFQLGDGDVELSDEVKALPWTKRLSVLRGHVQALREQVGARLNTIAELHDTLHRLWDDLGMSAEDEPTLAEYAKSPAATDDVVLSLERIAEYERLIAAAQTAKQERADTISDLVLKLVDLWNLLEVAPSTEFDQAVLDSNLGCTNEVMLALNTRIEQLTLEKDKREGKIREYGMRINSLWDKLQVPMEEREEFFDKSTQTLGPGAVKSCEVELDRLEQLYKASLKKLIEDARVKLLDQWKRLHVSKEERINFTAYSSEAYSEALLEAHQEELEKNAQLLATLEPILKLIETRENILKQKVSFEQETSDPKRLLSKGRDPGRLLREEKMRKLLETKLPKIETDLLRRLSEWEAQSGKVFMFEGEAYLEQLQHHLEESSSKIKKRKPLVERESRATESSNVSQTPSKTPRVEAVLRTPKVVGGSSKVDLNSSINTPSRVGTIKKPITPARAQVPTAKTITPRVATPFVTDKRAVATVAGGKRAAPFTPVSANKPRIPLSALQVNPPKCQADSGSPPKRPRLNLD